MVVVVDVVVDAVELEEVEIVVVGDGELVGGELVGGALVGDSFRNPNTPPNESLSVKIIISPLLGSTLRYSPALLASLSP